MEQPDDQRQLAIHGHGLLVPIPEETSPGTRGHGGRERCARGSTSPTAASDDFFRRIAELAVPMTDSRRGAGRRTAGLHPRYVEGAAAGSAILESALAELPRKPRIAALTSSGNVQPMLCGPFSTSTTVGSAIKCSSLSRAAVASKGRTRSAVP